MISPRTPRTVEVSSPRAAVFRPHAFGFAGVAVALLGGCESADSAQVTSPYVVAIGESEAPSYSDAELTLYESQVAVPFPVRAPTSSDRSGLPAAVAPYPSYPYLLDSDESIEVNYTISNLDDETHDVWLLIDPWNEFVRYRPGVTVVSEDETEPNLSGIEQAFVLAPKQRIQGNILPEQMSVLAQKLDVAMQIMASTFTAESAYSQGTLLNHDFNVQNTPNASDPLLGSYIPSVFAGMTGFDLGLQSYERMNVAIEVTITVIDQSGKGKVLPPGTTTGLIGAPPAFLRFPGSH